MQRLVVNGRQLEIDVEPDTPLLWVLRDFANLTGTKFGCGGGLCGACTVHIGGQAVRSCITAVADVQSQPVTTIEGITGKVAVALQQAWAELDVPQCGYCQSGQLMSASALLASNATPTDDDIDQAMSGNICRCATYVRIRKAIHRAAAIMKA
jgi:isoquinoline 1-oxidoreductase subunit alpha